MTTAEELRAVVERLDRQPFPYGCTMSYLPEGRIMFSSRHVRGSIFVNGDGRPVAELVFPLARARLDNERATMDNYFNQRHAGKESPPMLSYRTALQLERTNAELRAGCTRAGKSLEGIFSGSCFGIELSPAYDIKPARVLFRDTAEVRAFLEQYFDAWRGPSAGRDSA